jgi:membrane protease YdiL (CAAX protease family)
MQMCEKHIYTTATALTPLTFDSLMPPARVLWLLAGAPVLEEVIFRSGLQHSLGRRVAGLGGAGAHLANGATALLFAAAHLALQTTPTAALTLLPALLIGAVYQQRRSLMPCIALHSLFNAVWLLGAGAFFNP